MGHTVMTTSENDSAPPPPATAAGKYRSFYEGEEIIREGETGDEAYLIISGKVEVRVGTVSEQPKTIAILGKGEVLGEMALIDSGARSATAVALEETKVSVLSKVEFEQRAAEMDPLLKAVYGVTVKRLRAVLKREKETDPAPSLVNWKG